MSEGAQDPAPGGFRKSSRLDEVLRQALDEPAFLADLKERRSRAAIEAGFKLSPAERAVLDSAPKDALLGMVQALQNTQREVEHLFEEGLMLGGIRPDDVPADPLTDMRELPEPASKGHRPVLPVAIVAAGAVLVGGAAAGMLIVTGSRPDEPVPSLEPAEQQDAGPEGGDGGPDADAGADVERRD